MFSCISELAKSSESDYSGQEITMDQILDEASKLKRKCKSLRILLLETENKRSDEKKEYDIEITRLKLEIESEIANMQGRSYLELSELRDFYHNEINELNSTLFTAQNEINMQGALIVALTRKVSSLEKDLEIQEHTRKSDIATIKADHREELAQLYLTRQHSSPCDERAEMMRRALNAEAELSFLTEKHAQEIININGRHKKLLEEKEQYEFVETAKILDELDQVTEEKHKLEQQVQLLYKEATCKLQTESPSQSTTTATATATVSAMMSATLSPPRLNAHSSYERSCECERKLRDALIQVSELQEKVQKLVRTKTEVERAVNTVVLDNERLTCEVDELTRELSRIKLVI